MRHFGILLLLMCNCGLEDHTDKKDLLSFRNETTNRTIILSKYSISIQRNHSIIQTVTDKITTLTLFPLQS